MQKKIIILSGEMMERDDLGYFVIDPASVVLHKDRLIMDYNHCEEEVIGYVDDIHEENGQLVGMATIESVQEGDRASEVIKRIEDGTPYEISPTVMLSELGVLVDKAEKSNVSYNVYRNVPVRGISICPYGTDRLTSLLSLRGGKKMRKRTKKMVKMAADELENAVIETEVVDEVVAEEPVEPTYDAHPDLEEFIELFGFERGVNFYRRGLTKEEAEAEDYAQLKAKRLAAEEEGVIDEAGAVDDVALVDDAVAEADAEAAVVAEAQEEVDKAIEEKTGLRANIAVVKAVRALTAEVAKLKAVAVRGGNAVTSTQSRRPPMTALEKFALKCKRR